jgi:hypothetical protein
MFRHMGKKLAGVVFLTLALCGVAMAVWVLQGAIEGSSAPTKVAKNTTPTVVPIKVAFAAEKLEPGSSEPFMLTIENVTSTEVSFKNIALTITSSNEVGCPRTNLTVATTNGFWMQALEGKQTTATKIAAGATLALESVAAEFKITLASAAPIACETALFTVKALAT